MEFSDFVDARRTTLMRAAVLLGYSLPAAEELVQATLTTAFGSWRKVQRSDDIDSYIYRILVNTARAGTNRKWNGQSASEAPPESPLDADPSADPSPGMASRRALAAMGQEQRAVLVLRFLLDLPEETTAELLDLPASAVGVEDENWTSARMQEASETIDVAPAAFVPTPQDSRVPWLGLGLITAGFALILGLGMVLGWWSTEDKPQEVVKGIDNQIPSVFGYDPRAAKELLEGEGWRVTEVDALSCEPEGRALGTVPQGGATPSSNHVKLQVSVFADIPCNLGRGVDTEARLLAWRVIDFARTRSTLDFSDEVVVYVNGRHDSMSAAQADRRSKPLMQDLIRVISADASEVRVQSGTWTTPLLTTKRDRGDSVCGDKDFPKEFRERPSILMYAALPAFNEASTGQCHFLNVFSTDGVVDGLVLRTGNTAF